MAAGSTKFDPSQGTISGCYGPNSMSECSGNYVGVIADLFLSVWHLSICDLAELNPPCISCANISHGINCLRRWLFRCLMPSESERLPVDSIIVVQGDLGMYAAATARQNAEAAGECARAAEAAMAEGQQDRAVRYSTNLRIHLLFHPPVRPLAFQPAPSLPPPPIIQILMSCHSVTVAINTEGTAAVG